MTKWLPFCPCSWIHPCIFFLCRIVSCLVTIQDHSSKTEALLCPCQFPYQELKTFKTKAQNWSSYYQFTILVNINIIGEVLLTAIHNLGALILSTIMNNYLYREIKSQRDYIMCLKSSSKSVTDSSGFRILVSSILYAQHQGLDFDNIFYDSDMII